MHAYIRTYIYIYTNIRYVYINCMASITIILYSYHNLVYLHSQISSIQILYIFIPFSSQTRSTRASHNTNPMSRSHEVISRGISPWYLPAVSRIASLWILKRTAHIRRSHEQALNSSYHPHSPTECDTHTHTHQHQVYVQVAHTGGAHV